MADYVWFDVRLEFYDQPERRTGYRGAATRGGFRSVSLPRIGELLVSSAIIVGDLPGPGSAVSTTRSTRCTTSRVVSRRLRWSRTCVVRIRR